MNESTKPDIRKYMMPIVIGLVMLGVFTLMFAPMIKADPRDLPVAIVNLDEGVSTAQGDVNAGDEFEKNFTASMSEAGLLKITAVDDEESARADLEDSEYYAVLIIPTDFTATSVAAQQSTDSVAPALTLIVNQGKHPTGSQMVTQAFAALSATGQVTLTIELINPIPTNLGIAAATIPVLSVMLMLMPAYGVGIFIMRTNGVGATDRKQTLLTQLGTMAAAAIVVGLAGASLITWLVDMDLSFWHLVLFEIVTSFMFLSIVVASLNWLGFAGMGVPMIMLVLGGTAMMNFPYEFLPHFWQKWIYPWSPFQFAGNGARALFYQNAGAWSGYLTTMVVIAVIALVIWALSYFKPVKKDDEANAIEEVASAVA